MRLKDNMMHCSVNSYVIAHKCAGIHTSTVSAVQLAQSIKLPKASCMLAIINHMLQAILLYRYSIRYATFSL